MNKKIKLILLVGGMLFVFGSISYDQKVSEKDLSPKYQEWLKLVAYIIQPVEQDVFLKLTNDRDRDLFIDMFWKQRDPTPGTPANEYRDEMIKRFQYVNRVYGRSSVREGWQTDMGKIYMILGPPASIERFETSSWLVPCQAWTYYGDTTKDLPPLFVILFFQRGHIGDYKLYNANVDGPTSLLMNKRELSSDLSDEDIYEKIKEIAPTLADLSISMVPGEIYYDYRPSPRNNIIMAQIFQSPKKDINPSYATHFLELRGLVSTEYLTNFIESNSSLSLILDPQTGLRFLHYSVAPTSVSLDFYEPKRQHFCNYETNVSLRVGNDVIFQYNRDFPIYIADENIDRVQANGISIEDSFPISPGKFKLIILLTNSVGKEFSVVEKEIIVPEDITLPKIGGPYLGYKIETYRRDVHIPFKLGTQKVVVDPKYTFSAADEIKVIFNVENLTEDIRSNGEVLTTIRGLKKELPVTRQIREKLKNYPLEKILTVSQSIPARELEPDYYEIAIALIGANGQLIDEAKSNFVVSPSAVMGHPIANAKGFPLANQFLYLYMLGQQEEKLGKIDRARTHYEKAFNLNPNYLEGVVMFANFMIMNRDFDSALNILERVKSDSKREFDYFLLKGQALMGKEMYEAALESLLSANRIYNSDIQVLNGLGLCYYRMGLKTRAVEALNASLKLNPNQPEMKKLLAEVNRLK